MTSSQISVLMIVVSLGLILVTNGIVYVVPLEERRLRRGKAQRAALESALVEAAGTSLEMDWRTYGEVPKADIIALASAHSWTLVSDEITAAGWMLTFAKDRQSDH
ncbi:hypothetical protein ACFQ1S_19485 [Kibdelosporangium lantanae]|uniref:Uncharacterized protein n=1 Tax=Kibdelosporangium lantanae TaxID=1497396 RepID=A0ABW3M9Y2_9PSEU